MASSSQLSCVIAAGGTAGHVMPSLAVAQVLRARGVSVSFAGSPDRIEAQLVPESGFEFDPFSISGLPRRPGKSQLRAVLLAGRAPRACARILSVRQPDVVLGGGVRGRPDGYAAWRKRIPSSCAICFACCVVNRSPYRSRVESSLRTRSRAASAPSTVSSAGRSLLGRRFRRPRHARGSGCRRMGRCCSSSAAARARLRSTRSRSKVSAQKGRQSSTSAGSGTAPHWRGVSRGRTTG